MSEVRLYRGGEGGDLGAVLAFIGSALEAGDSAAIPAGAVAAFARGGLFRPLTRGDYRGAYLFGGVRRRVRRCALGERLLAAMLLVLLAPVLVLTALLVLVFDGMPVFFRQLRFGMEGRPFDILKFRTMVVNGGELHGVMQHLFGKRGHLFKMENDPRVTALGVWLRALCLDELPQLLNVVRGDMRLCGPRPLPESDSHHYTDECHRMRLRGLPGITGLWQVSGRNRIGFDEMCLLDIFYLCNSSLWMDVRIALRTVAVVLARR